MIFDRSVQSPKITSIEAHDGQALRQTADSLCLKCERIVNWVLSVEANLSFEQEVLLALCILIYISITLRKR